MSRRAGIRLAAVVQAAFLLGGCGGGTPTAGTTPTTSPTPSPTPSPSAPSPTAEPASIADLGSVLWESAAHAISRDGTTIVGSAYTQLRDVTHLRAFRWTSSEGMIAISPPVPGESSSRGGGGAANAVSAGGEVVAGTSTLVDVFGPLFFSGAFQWSATDGFTPLGSDTSLPALRSVNAMTPDGTVFVGEAQTADTVSRAYRLGRNDDEIEILPVPDGCSDCSCQAAAVADDASAVGSCAADSVSWAVRWDAAGAPVVLAAPPGFESCAARAVSADGATTAGDCSAGGVTRAVRWRGDEPEALAELPTELSSRASGISAEGEMVLGTLETEDRDVAFVWTENGGKRTLRDILAEAGLIDQLRPWFSLETAASVSADRRIVVGTGLQRVGFGRRAFRAVLP